jgi:hypothetical protein
MIGIQTIKAAFMAPLLRILQRVGMQPGYYDR